MTAAHHDVIIIGAGSVGLPSALAMAQAGLDVLIIDRAASPGQGSHKAAIGGVRATHSDPAKIALCLRSLEIFSTWDATYGQDIAWSQGGYSFVVYREQERRLLKELLAVQHRYGLDIAWLDTKGLLEILPDLNPVDLLGGTYSPGDGHCSTLLAGHAFYEEAKRAGATFRFGETVVQLKTDHGRVTGLATDSAAYAAPIVLNAAGACASQIGAMAGIEHPIVSEAHEAGITEPVAPFLRPLVVDLRPSPGASNCYFFQLATGQLVFCLTPDPPAIGSDCRETSAFLPAAARRLVTLVPRLAELRVRRTWRGLYPLSPDGAPLVGWSPPLQGYLVAIALCGQGFMLGPGMGELLARVVIGGELSESDQEILTRLSPARDFREQERLR